jgi:curved DNA-binding protein CbpA
MPFKLEHGLFRIQLIDHHAILGVSLTADPLLIRKRYLKMAQRLHPDKCKNKSPQEQQLANELLSKLVNPAYELLSKDKSRNEHLIVLAQTGKRLADEAHRITIASDVAQQLYQAQGNLDQVYQNLLKSLAEEQYLDLDQASMTIAHLSELNLVYLMLKQGQGIRGNIKENIPNNTVTSSSATTKQTAEKAQTTVKTETPASAYLRRAQEYINRKQFSQAILELRDAEKIEPNNSACYSLQGLAYLKQQQITMAKIQVKKALQLNATDPIALECQQALERLNPKAKADSKQSKGGGLFGGLFGGKKK